MDKCTICSAEFSLEEEGGIDGHLGMIPIMFCPTCLSGIMDMADQINGVEDEDDTYN